jgi:hypothetical protein
VRPSDNAHICLECKEETFTAYDIHSRGQHQIHVSAHAQTYIHYKKEHEQQIRLACSDECKFMLRNIPNG